MKSEERHREATSVVGSVGLSWVLLLKTSPLLFPTVFEALPGHPCQSSSSRHPLALSFGCLMGTVSPAVPGDRQLPPKALEQLVPSGSQLAQGVQSNGSPRVTLSSSLPGSRNHPLSLPQLLIPRPTGIFGVL